MPDANHRCARNRCGFRAFQVEQFFLELHSRIARSHPYISNETDLVPIPEISNFRKRSV
jgi:hypothetical protein